MNHDNSIALIVTAHDGLYSRVAMYFCVGGGRSYWLLGVHTYQPIGADIHVNKLHQCMYSTGQNKLYVIYYGVAVERWILITVRY